MSAVYSPTLRSAVTTRRKPRCCVPRWTTPLAATGYQPPPADSRTPQQRLHDQQHGITFGLAGETVLPDQLAV